MPTSLDPNYDANVRDFIHTLSKEILLTLETAIQPQRKTTTKQELEREQSTVPLIIGIFGYSGSGKDTLANMMKEEMEAKGKRVKICHFATALKKIATECFEWKGHKDSDTELGRKGRRLLQLLGTEVARECVRSTFWTDKIKDLIEQDEDGVDCWLIPDVRFQNEFDFVSSGIEGVNGCTVEIVRPWLDLSDAKFKHQSEQDLNSINADVTVTNDGSIEELHIKAMDCVVFLMEHCNGQP